MEQVGLAQGAANTSPDRLNLDMQQALKPQHFFDVSKLPHALTEAEVKP
jgi:hypothetical protein